MSNNNDFSVSVSPTMALLQATKLGQGGDPEGNAIAARNLLSLMKTQHNNLSTCPVTAQIKDGAHSTVSTGIETGVRRTEAFIAFTR